MKKMTARRIAAIIGVVLLVLLYVITLIAAIFDFDGSGTLFRACLVATVGVPIFLWVYTWLFRRLTGRDTDEGRDGQ